MLETIQKTVFAKYKAEEPRGLFFSAFATDGSLLLSNGVVSTEKPLSALIDLLYHGMVEPQLKNTKTLMVDVVTSFQQETDMQKILTLTCQDHGVCLVGKESGKSGVILPNMQGVADVKQALVAIKQKYEMGGNVDIYSFTTERIVVEQ